MLQRGLNNIAIANNGNIDSGAVENGKEEFNMGTIVGADNGDGTYAYTMFYKNSESEYSEKSNYKIYNQAGELVL